MTGIGGDLTERRRARLKEPRVQTGPVPIGQGQQRMRQREDDMHIRHVEELALARLRLTLRAVPVPTRVVGDGLMPAGVTPVEMPTERGRSTARDRAEHGPLLHAEPRMLLEEGVTLRVEDMGHLHGGPAHGAGGFRSSRDRCRTIAAGTCNCSSGLGAAWRWRCDRWRYTVVCVRSACPSSTWMVRRSAPASRRCVAYECRRVCGLTRRSIPAAVAAKRTASQTTFEVSGRSARHPSRVPGNKYVCGRIQRSYARRAASRLALSGTSRPCAPLPRSTRSTIRWLSMSQTFSCRSSLRRRPVPYSVISIVRWYRFFAPAISRRTSSGLRTVGGSRR